MSLSPLSLYICSHSHIFCLLSIQLPWVSYTRIYQYYRHVSCPLEPLLCQLSNNFNYVLRFLCLLFLETQYLTCASIIKPSVQFFNILTSLFFITFLHCPCLYTSFYTKHSLVFSSPLSVPEWKKHIVISYELLFTMKVTVTVHFKDMSTQYTF